jgi:hypothetical protein
MELIAPDILAEVRQLSPLWPVAAFLVGGVWWLAGWWTHRFWIVLGFTVTGGILGLQNAAELHAQPLLAAIGVALAAGILALTLVRVVAFVAGGAAGLVLVHALSPSWDQPLVSFLAGGLLGYFLFRYWMMALTSLGGVVTMVYAGLALIDKLGRLDAVTWSEGHGTALTAGCGLAAAAGCVVQFFIDWLRNRAGGSKDDKKEGKKDKKEGGVLTALAAFRRAG